MQETKSKAIKRPNMIDKILDLGRINTCIQTIEEHKLDIDELIIIIKDKKGDIQYFDNVVLPEHVCYLLEATKLNRLNESLDKDNSEDTI